MPKKTVELIIEGENDYIIPIKKNQPNLLKVATELAESSIAIDTNYHDENLHGRKTTRQVKVYPIPFESLPDWVGAKSLIEVNRYGTRPQGKKSRRQIVDYHEQHFYLSSLNCSASEFAEAIRGHWSIENQLHWVKDVTLNEDNCIHTGGFSPANWAMVRQFLVSLARQLDSRTLPEALRLMAKQLQMIFDALFNHSDSFCPMPVSLTVEGENFFSPDN
ncbi:ISAs1 family transposase [Nostoc sp. C057]|nr:ISAs1 family transposase [Nostoc sp. C057]QLE48528.1 ISAs1 family transposase [Nostoc sp. C057]